MIERMDHDEQGLFPTETSWHLSEDIAKWNPFTLGFVTARIWLYREMTRMRKGSLAYRVPV
jgi:hypothetical protein